MHPKDVKRFKAWSAAMVEGATVDKPNYGKSLARRRRSKIRARRARRRWRKNATD